MNLNDKIKANIREVENFPKVGINFKDITPLFLLPDLCEEIIDAMHQQWMDKNIDAIAGIESRGFLWGILLAQKMKLPFIMIRKKGKLPADTSSMEYDLEYDTAIIEVHKGFIKENMNVLIHDDLLATGGTAQATAKLIKQEKGAIAGFSFVVNLQFLNGEKILQPYSTLIQSLVTY